VIVFVLVAETAVMMCCCSVWKDRRDECLWQPRRSPRRKRLCQGAVSSSFISCDYKNVKQAYTHTRSYGGVVGFGHEIKGWGTSAQ